MNEITFIVEEAGCESCAERVRSALGDLLTIETITIDEAGDTATVVARAERSPSVADLDAALAAASGETGHTYRVRK